MTIAHPRPTPPPSNVTIRAASEKIPPGQEGWAEQQALLFRHIRSEGGVLLPPPSGSPSTKGIPDFYYLLVPLMALERVVNIIKLWVQERDRVVVFEVTKDGKTTRHRIKGRVSDQTVREVLKHALDQHEHA